MMKDSFPENALPACPLSKHCFRLVDDLDASRADGGGDGTEYAEDDAQLIRRLRTHLPDCPVCTAALEEARRVRDQQRYLLGMLLREGERNVPSTIPHILKAVGREALASYGAERPARKPDKVPEAPTFARRPGRMTPRRSGGKLSKVMALVAVMLVVLTSLGLFGYIRVQHEAANSLSRSSLSGQPSRPRFVPGASWLSVVMTRVELGIMSISLFEPATGRSIDLAMSNHPTDTVVDGVSHNGDRLLYHVYDGRETSYYLVSQEQAKPLYTFSGKSGEALWSTDDKLIFINTPAGIQQVNVAQRTAGALLPPHEVGKLHFFHEGFLYYSSDKRAARGTLKRINSVSGEVQAVTNCPESQDFWLSPDGVTIYCRLPDTPNNLYAVNDDGTNPQVLRTTGVGPIVGFAEDNALLTLNTVNNKSQIVKLGANATQDQVVFDALASGAQSLTADEIAVAPYGHALVASAVYGDGSQKVLYADLVTGRQRMLSTFQISSNVQLVGWSRLAIVGR